MKEISKEFDMQAGGASPLPTATAIDQEQAHTARELLGGGNVATEVAEVFDDKSSTEVICQVAPVSRNANSKLKQHRTESEEVTVMKEIPNFTPLKDAEGAPLSEI